MSVRAAHRVVDALGRPLDVALQARRRPSVVVLIYHRVGRRTDSPVDLPLATFKRHVDWLTDGGVVLGVDAAAQLLRTGPDEVSPRTRVVLSFDDGTADWPDTVLPVLLEHRLPATFFVSTAFVEQGSPFPDDGRPVSWAGLRDMATTGLVTFGSHTHTHRVLANASANEAGAELDRSIGLIEERLDRPCHHFAYPKAIAPSPAAEVVVRRRFFTAALAGNVANIAGRTDFHRVGRHALSVADDDDSFRRKAAGGKRLEGWLRSCRDAWRGPTITDRPQ